MPYYEVKKIFSLKFFSKKHCRLHYIQWYCFFKLSGYLKYKSSIFIYVIMPSLKNFRETCRQPSTKKNAKKFLECDNGIWTLLKLRMAVVPSRRRPLLRQTNEAFSFIFTSRKARGKNKQKMPKWAEGFAKQSLKRRIQMFIPMIQPILKWFNLGIFFICGN